MRDAGTLRRMISRTVDMDLLGHLYAFFPAALLKAVFTGLFGLGSTVVSAEMPLFANVLVAASLATAVALATGTLRWSGSGAEKHGAPPLFATRPILDPIFLLSALSAFAGRSRRALKLGSRPILSLCQWLSRGRGWLRPDEVKALAMALAGLLLLLSQVGVLIPGGRLP